MSAKKGFTQFCEKCSKNIGTYGFKRHYNVCTGPTISKPYVNPMFGKTPWNKGLTKEKNESIAKQSKSQKKSYIDGGKSRGCITWSSEKRKEYAKNNGGYRENAGHSKKFRVADSFGKIVTLQSTYELECAKILDDLHIKWIRPRSLKYDGRRYYPDFELVDFGIFLDPKNTFKAKLDAEKIQRVCEQNQVRVIVLLQEHLTKEHIQEIIGE